MEFLFLLYFALGAGVAVAVIENMSTPDDIDSTTIFFLFVSIALFWPGVFGYRFANWLNADKKKQK